MSSVGQTQGSASQDSGADVHNQENMLSRLRGAAKNRIENRENVNPKPGSRTVLGALENNQRRQPVLRGAKQLSGPQIIACKSEEHGRSFGEKPSTRPPAFQIHVDEPDGACSKKRATMDCSPLALNPTVTRLRQPLATIDLPMEASFDSPMDMSVIDGEERPTNVNEVSDYATEIHAHLREMEVKSKPKAGYMKKQPDITNSMRAILVDWLVEVGEEYKLQNETLYLAVNYIDRFLSSMSVLRGKLQLVGTAAMLLASKFEEIYPPEVAEFVYITDDTYTKKQVLRMEHLVLTVLSFDLAAPTINQFLTQYFLHQPVSSKVESLSMFLGELSLIDCDPFLKYLPSQTAAAAFILANHTIAGGSWSKALVEMTGYTLVDLMLCIQDLHQIYLGAAQHTQQAVREKYKGSKYHEVSLIEPPEKLMLN
ncbi:cyclin-A2-like isoform X1 [Sinocyclocheilus rhinocerous]|uniref:Cyclin-A2 n=2 Tax=Sinocyclocheilus rhinocerous TaxID=307959 RepID=A0A673GU81_9TELE|nr:PREDICTED: cyclin-A2-like isoform X1 [Sinocyclocheilus rhinocerous]XP_016429096.1 PREDICTED: cyclin-A2-like isoform X1 [Sinocyclocheilus rhinocerous]